MKRRDLRYIENHRDLSKFFGWSLCFLQRTKGALDVITGKGHPPIDL